MTTTIETTLHYDLVSTGSRERARAIREYRRLHASAAHALLLADNPRCGLDTMLRLQDEASAMTALATELSREWNLRSYNNNY